MSVGPDLPAERSAVVPPAGRRSGRPRVRRPDPLLRVLLAIGGVSVIVSAVLVGYIAYMSSRSLFAAGAGWGPRELVLKITPVVALSSMPGLVWLIVERLRGNEGPLSPRAAGYVHWMLWFGAPSAFIWSWLLLVTVALAFQAAAIWLPPALAVTTGFCMIPYARRRLRSRPTAPPAP